MNIHEQSAIKDYYYNSLRKKINKENKDLTFKVTN